MDTTTYLLFDGVPVVDVFEVLGLYEFHLVVTVLGGLVLTLVLTILKKMKKKERSMDNSNEKTTCISTVFANKRCMHTVYRGQVRDVFTLELTILKRKT